MDNVDFTTVITLSGAKASLMKMLNAALRSVGANIALADTEGGKNILRKLNENSIVFQLQDLLNEGCEPLPREGAPVDEDGTEYFEDYGLRLADIQQKGGRLTLVFHFWSGKDDMGEWDYESDYEPFFYELLPRYKCEATVIKGAGETPQWAVTFWYIREEVTHYYYEPLAESAAYQKVLEKLVEINPKRYLPFLRGSMKHQTGCIQDRLDRALVRLMPKADAKRYDDNAYFKQLIYSIIKDKIFLSNGSSCMATVVKKLPKEVVPGLVLFDGMDLYDGIDGVEDDIQQMNSFTKDGERVNLEDYYTENGAFDDGGMIRFLAALERLMTIDEFIQYTDTVGDGTDLPENPEDYNDLALYPIDENGHAEIPAGTTRIKGEAFINCSKLVSVTIPDTVREIRGLAFGGCTNLASIEIPSSVRLIEPSAFVGCKSLASVIFLTSGSLLIEERAFSGCTSLTNVVFKNDPLKVIAPNAFEGCPCEDEVFRICQRRRSFKNH